MPKAMCVQCGAEWKSTRWEHCTECHETFAGSKPADAHRVGPFYPLARTCLGAPQMEEAGMWATPTAGGRVWHGSGTKKGTVNRRPPRVWQHHA